MDASGSVRTERRGFDEVDTLDLWSQTWFAVVRARGAMRASMSGNAVLEPLGLTLRSYAVLAAACADRGLSQREVATYTLIDERQVVGLIGELEELGYVRRAPDPTDRRVRVMSATKAGREAYRRAHALLVQRQAPALATLSRAEHLMLVDLLAKIGDDDHLPLTDR